MASLSEVLNQLDMERKRAQSELNRLETAIQALRGVSRNGSRSQIKRSLSPAARRRISLAQKARWARKSVSAQPSISGPKRRMSAAARRRIAAAQKARWAAWRAKQKKAA
jgi:hypothetical protein